jgi:ABC-type uncharacterized transport system auxiliary subunit
LKEVRSLKQFRATVKIKGKRMSEMVIKARDEERY